MAIFKKKSSKQQDRDHGARSPTNSPPVQAQPSLTAAVQRDVSNSYAPPNPSSNPRRMTSQQLPFSIGAQGQTGRQSPSVTSPTQATVPPSGSYPLGLGLPTPIQNPPSIMQVQNSAPGYNVNNPGMMQNNNNPPGIMQNNNPPGIIQNHPPGIMQNANQGVNGQGPPVQGQQAPAPGQPPNPGYPWSTRPLRLYQPVTNPPTAPLSPFPRYGLSVPPYPSHSGHMLLFGGLVRDHAHNDLWSLDVRDCQLQLVKTRGDAPLPRIGHVSAIAERIMLVFGGDTKINEDDKQDDGLYVLDLRTQEWTSVPVLAGPSGRYGHAACMLGGCLYVHGGHVDGRNLDDLWAFDIRQIAQDNGPYKWERITHTSPAAPLARTGHTLVPYRNKLYLFGGTDGDYHYNDSWSFDIVTGVWTELECIGYIPIPREGHAAAIVDDVVYVFGGRDVHGKDLGDLAAFRISNQRWYMFQNMGPSPMAKSGHSLCAAHGKIFVLGGESNLSPQVQRDDPNLIHVLDTTKIKYPADNQPPRGAAPRGRTTSDATDLRSANNSGPYQGGAPNQAQARSHDNLPRTLSPTVTASEPRPLIIANDTGANNSKHRAGSESISSDLGRQAPNLGPGGVLSPGFSTPNGVPPQRPKRDGDDEYRRAMSPPAGAGAMMAAGAGAGMGAAAAMGAVAANSMGPNGDAPNEQTATEGPQSPVSQTSQTRELPVNGTPANGPASPTSPNSKIVASHTPHPNPRNSHSPPPELRFEGRPSLPPDAFYFGAKSPTGGGSRPGSMVGGRPGSLLGRPGSIVGNRPGSIAGTADLIREIKARENEADNAKRREAALRVILNKAIQQGYVVDDEAADLPSGDEVDNAPTQQLVTVIMQMKQEKANLQNEVAAQMRVASDKIQDAERMQKGALQEAAFYRAKVAAFESGSTVEINRLDTERIADLERQLESTGKAYTPLTMEVERLRAEVDRHNEMTALATDSEADTLKRAEEAEEANAQLQDELEQLRQQVSTRDKSINDHTERFIMLTSTHQQREAERDQYKTQLDDAVGKREELLKLIEEAQAGIMAASARNTELEGLHGTAREQVSSLEAELAEVRQLLDAKTREAEQATARLAEAETLHNTTREEANNFRTMTSGRLGELLESHRALQNDDERAVKSYGDQMRALEEEKSSLLKLLREAGQRVDETESVATSHRQKARELEVAHQQMRGEMRVHRTKLHGAQTEISKYRDLCSAKDAELRERDQAVTELTTRVGLMRKVLGEHGIAVSDNDLDNAEAPTSNELEAKLRDKSRAHDNAQREIEELTLRCQEAENKVESLGRLVERIKDGRSPSAASTRNTPSPTTSTGVGTPGDADRRAVEAERRLQEVEAQHKAKLAALEGDYQTAVRYVKGTEKMLKRMKDELNKQKSTNTALSNELDQMRGRAPSVEPGVSRSLSGRQTPSDSDLARRLQALQGQYSSLQAEIAAQADVLSARQREVDVLRMRCEESERENEVLREDLAQAQHRIATLLEMNQTGIHLGSDDEERVGLRRGSSASSDGGASTAFDKFTKELKQWERARSPDAHGDAESAGLLSDHDMSVHSGSRGGSRADSRSNGNIAPSPGVMGSLPATLVNGSRTSPGQTPITPSVYSAASDTGVVFPPAVAAGGADMAGPGAHAVQHGGLQHGVHSRSSSSYSGDWTQ